MNRFEVRHRNGTFHVFDTVYYGVASSRDSAAQAQREVNRLNSRPEARRVQPRR